MKRLRHIMPAALVILSAVPAHAQFQPVFSCGTVLSTPGNYQLANNLDCLGGNGVTITASNVTLQLNGKRISGGGPAGVAVSAPGGTRVNHVAVQGPGQIVQFGVGVDVSDADYSLVSQLVLSANVTQIRATNSTFLTVQSNITTFGDYGIQSSSCSSCTFNGNSASRTNKAGILLLNGTSNALINNVVNGNGGATGAGILITTETGVRVSGNTTDGNNYGIRVDGGGTAQVFNNTSYGNYGFDLLDINTCSGHVWSDNNFFNANDGCIR